ncbi:benzoate-CoA ligase family protein [Desulfotomaculum copahuensis]|uniref:4-hydroxybenzoate--CoA ligase n=1 Tax=Desulfotomaculum copahuensis TaxID=1838280 RepID=A0A1B7LGS4_9FIRM|nr:benzoate-CoA ligase family protein [Desulfotomaculum copahuensis]OAT85303.1 4-hydroxybenzoate--CoA ligase [Desulfotomaculum copahuensis]
MTKIDLPDKYNAVTTFVDCHVEEGRSRRVAIYYQDRSITYGEVYEMVNRAGNALLELGVERENRVFLLLPDSPELVYLYFGAMKIGAVPIPMNNRLPAADYLYMLNDSRSKVVVIPPEMAEVLEKVKPSLCFARHFVTTGNVPGYLNFYDLLAGAAPSLAPAETSKDDAAFWLYSSGSTGAPKGVVHLHHDWIHCCELYARNILNIRPDDISMSVSKLFHAYGLGNGLMFPFRTGGSTVLYPEVPRPEPFLTEAARRRVTLFYGVPTFYAAALALPGLAKRFDLSSVRLCVSAGEPLPAAIYRRWRDCFGVEILDGIGSTEVLHIYVSSRPGEVLPGSTGKPVPGYEVKVLDENSCELPPGQTGTLWVKGESATPYFWNKHQRSKELIRGEWFNTGDRWYVDEDGYYWYSGRADDAFKCRGEWVEPVEIENLLIEHEAVLESGVVGCPFGAGLEKPVAFVVLKPGYEGTAEQVESLKLFVRERMPGYKVPEEIRFVDELPKTITGKIKRFVLREILRQEAERVGS